MKVLVHNDDEDDYSSNMSGGMKAQTSTTLLMLLQFLFCFLTTKLMSQYGRKPLMLTSFIGMSVFHFLFVVTIFFNGKVWQYLGMYLS